ncbi:MAG TPA: peptidase S10 [Roseiarcus sp.]|nr:peptidase S10 [Roseiarcus sp.]
MPLRLIAAALALALSGAAVAADCPAAAPAGTPEAATPGADARALPPDVTRPQSLALPGRCLAFHSIAGSIRIPDAQGKTRADIAYVAYLLDGRQAPQRPVTFALNGGPGAGSVWLQLGAIGPWRLPMQGLAPSTPPTLVDNAETWLDFTDLVFLDPPGTGYSRPRDPKAAEGADVWSVDGDIGVLADTVRRWLAAHGRLDSPKFIVGESYGGFRAPKLAKTLASHYGVGVSGIALISPVLDFGPFADGLSNPFPYLTRLPSYAAATREAKGPVARADLADVEAYAKGEYLADWLAGPRDAAAVARKVARVAALTGLPAEVVRRYDGDLSEDDYLRERGRQLGAKVAFYDATLTAGATAPNWPDAEDPVLPGFVPAFTSAISALYRDRLGWRVDDLYETLNAAVSRHWRWGRGLNAPEALGDLAQQLALDPGFRVLVEHGLTDVQAPYFATALELDRLPPFAPPQRLTLSVHPGGHMFYMRDASRRALRDEARRLIEGP